MIYLSYYVYQSVFCWENQDTQIKSISVWLQVIFFCLLTTEEKLAVWFGNKNQHSIFHNKGGDDDDEFNQYFTHLSKKDKLIVLKFIEKIKGQE